jgi:hypothetical protein
MRMRMLSGAAGAGLVSAAGAVVRTAVSAAGAEVAPASGARSSGVCVRALLVRQQRRRTRGVYFIFLDNKKKWQILLVRWSIF